MQYIWFNLISYYYHYYSIWLFCSVNMLQRKCKCRVLLLCLQSNTSYVAGCRDSGAVAFTDLYDVLVNLPAREITVAPHAKGNSIVFKPCPNV
jgi:hypothetical protein